MRSPFLTIDLDKIEHNAAAIVALCRRHGVGVAGVTKATCGNPDVALAMLRGGVGAIGESHVENIRRMKAAGVRATFLLLQMPALSAVDEVVEDVDVSLNSELAVLEGLSRAARKRGRVHEVVLMVDLGDLREGIWPDGLLEFVARAARLPGIRIKGLGTNLACFGAVAPSAENMRQLGDLAVSVERTFGIPLEWVSGINSSGLELLAAGATSARVNHARIGEAMLLGRETVCRRAWPGTVQDAFTLHAEIVELRRKPSQPIGQICEDAFGKHPRFEDRGEVLRALLNVGREDVDIAGLAPVDPRIVILGGSSDYLVADVEAAAGELRVGDELRFTLSYGALLAAMTSEYVGKQAERGGGSGGGVVTREARR